MLCLSSVTARCSDIGQIGCAILSSKASCWRRKDTACCPVSGRVVLARQRPSTLSCIFWCLVIFLLLYLWIQRTRVRLPFLSRCWWLQVALQMSLHRWSSSSFVLDTSQLCAVPVVTVMGRIIFCLQHKQVVCSARGYWQCQRLFTVTVWIARISDVGDDQRLSSGTTVFFFCSMNSVVVCSSGSCLQHQQMWRTSTVIRNVTVSQQGLWVVQCCDRLRVTKNVCIIILCSGHRQWTMCSFFLPLPLSLFFFFFYPLHKNLQWWDYWLSYNFWDPRGILPGKGNSICSWICLNLNFALGRSFGCIIKLGLDVCLVRNLSVLDWIFHILAAHSLNSSWIVKQ